MAKKQNDRTPPESGTKYNKIYKGKKYVLRVEESSGQVRYFVDKLNSKNEVIIGTKSFKSPTAAAISITKNSVNGWRFWKIS